MFEPPRALIFNGTFEEAKAAASGAGHWLLLNLQSPSQFASHQWNRDVWRDSTVAALVAENFVLYQVYDVVEEAQKPISGLSLAVAALVGAIKRVFGSGRERGETT